MAFILAPTRITIFAGAGFTNQQSNDVITQILDICFECCLFVSISSRVVNLKKQHVPCIISGTFILDQLYPGHLARSGAVLCPQTGCFSVATPTALLTEISSRDAGTGRVSTFLSVNTGDQFLTTISHKDTKCARGACVTCTRTSALQK